MSLPLQSRIIVNKRRGKDYYLWLAFFILVCTPWFSLISFYNILYDINASELIRIASDLTSDRLYMNADSGSESGDDVPDLTSDTSDVSDTDHEQGEHHQALQDQLDQRAEEHQRLFEDQARLEDDNRRLNEQVAELEGRINELNAQSRRVQEFAQEQCEQAKQLEEESRVLVEQVRETRETIDRNSEEILNLQIRQISL